mgnify:CR=1 FL=1
MHPLEVKVVELLVALIPCAEMVRFSENGSDVTSAGIRVARAYTGREKAAKCGYHGAQDGNMVSTSRDWGVPRFHEELLFEFKYNQIKILDEIFAEHSGDISAVIIEPSIPEEPQDEILQHVMNLAHRDGAVLIFDEVKSEFSEGLGGAQEYYDVVPDLAAIGKAMANGMPISALVGRKKIMKKLETVFFSMIFGGEVLSLAATLSTTQELR